MLAIIILQLGLYTNTYSNNDKKKKQKVVGKEEK